MIANSWQIKPKRLGRLQGRGVKNHLSRVGWRGSLVTSASFFASMKTLWVIIALAGLSVTAIRAQEALYQVTERGANHRVWQRTIYETGPDGRPMPHVHQYTELTTGLHYLNHGEWTESREQIDLLPDGTAAATNGQHQAYFPTEIYGGVITLVTPDGQELTSRPLGLGYDDGSNTVLIAELTHSTGHLVGANQALYPDAFTGLKADLLYTYTRAGFEQYIILRESPLTPEAFGLDPARARLQVLTEFFNAPEPAVTTTVRPGEAGMALPDQNVAFGAMAMVPGRAFLLGGDAPPGNVMVSKSWVKLEGRHFLIEEVPVEALADQLAVLPLPPEASNQTGANRHSVASRQRQLPPARHAQAGPAGPFRRIARAALPIRGLVLDYQIFSGSETPYNFKSDTTYYISGNVCAYGTNTFEGGAVLKFATNGEIQITPGPVSTRINWKAGAYRPVIFTAKDDDSVGDPISDSTGHPSGYYGDPMLYLASLDSITLTNFRMSYAATGIGFGGVSGSLYDVQFVNCQNGLVMGGVDLLLGNALFANTKTNFVFQGGATVSGQNITFDGAACLAAGPAYFGANALALTNCLLSDETALTNGILTLTGDHNGFYNSPGFGLNQFSDSFDPFQSIGAGNYYLAGGSAFTNAGTTNIASALLTGLRQTTTQPPLVCSNITFSGNLTFSPQVQRDTGAPDLGYHYDPIDYAVGGISLCNANVAVYPGTVIGVFGTSNNAFGLNVGPGVEFLCKGLATNWNRIVAYNTVQEQTGTSWQNPANGLMIDAQGDASSLFNSRFTDWSVLAQDAPHLAVSNHTTLVLRDCQFHGGSLVLDYPDEVVSKVDFQPVLLAGDPALSNCLLERVRVILHVMDGSSSSVQNNLFFGGTLNYRPQNGEALVQNNLFDQTEIPDNSSVSGEYLGGFNAYVTNFNRLKPESTNDLILTNPPVYQTGPLGNDYQPSNSRLINAGSTNADVVGLYDYTVLTNLVSGREIKETNSLVDIGYHYVAADSGGNPLVTNTNGLPDYLYESSMDELPDWWAFIHFGNLNQLAGWDYDNDGTNNLTEYQNGVDPNKISFSFTVPNQYVATNLVDGVITILGGVPSSIAKLVDGSTETNWVPYTSSNITVDIGTTPGAHDVWIGLRGRLETSYQSWEGTTLILNSIQPTITITNPANSGAFNASRVNVSGTFTAGALKQITVNGIPAFTNDTSFEARNVPLSGGTNVITAMIEDLTGTTNAVSIGVMANTNSDGSLNDPVQLVATPVAGFEPLTVTFQISRNAAPGTQQQVLWDFNGDGLADFTTNNPGPVTYAYTNGEYFPVVTLQTDVGKFSSIGGWNAVSLDSTNQPIRINVQMQPTLTTAFSNFPNPVDLKWDGSHLYILSGSSAAIYEFALNGDTIRSMSLPNGSNPSGLDVDGAGNVYVAVTASNQVWKFNPTDTSFQADTNFGIGGFIGLTNGAAGSDTNQFNGPYDVAVLPDGGTISVSDSTNNRIQQFSPASGAFIASFGSQGSNVGQFNAPKGLTYDAYGTLYIVDSGNNRIALAQSSTVMGVTGSGGNGLGQFCGAKNIGIGKRGIYVADTGNNQIQKFDLPAQGLFEITAGNVGYALSAGLSSPAAVAAVDNLTNELFYVADTGHNQVLLCHLPDSNADAIQTVWNGMTNRIANGDISGAAQFFCSKTADGYQQAFFCIGAAKVISDVNDIGPLTPVYIESGLAEYYFEQTVEGIPLLFPVEFIKEDGTWKILEF
jgi:hypothetical protein